MNQDEFDPSKITTRQAIFDAMEKRKLERSKRLARLPIVKKLEMVEKFNAIIREALEEDDRRRALEANLLNED